MLEYLNTMTPNHKGRRGLSEATKTKRWELHKQITMFSKKGRKAGWKMGQTK